jgi:hypothetical protein
MSDLTPGQRVTIRPDVDRFAGQHGTITSIDPTTTGRPVYVHLDGDFEPRRFDPDELGPNTQDTDTTRRLDTITAHAMTLATAFATAGITLTDEDNTLIGWLCGWETSTVNTIASWITRAHAGSEHSDDPALAGQEEITGTALEQWAGQNGGDQS